MQRREQTKQAILEAAQEVFHRYGYQGARMQQIADEAGVNKAMLHYYFRSKERLFEEVFRVSSLKIIPYVFAVLNAPLPLEEKIERFVREYIDIVAANPTLPSFILHELDRNPQHLDALMRTEINLQAFASQVRAAVEKGGIRPVEPEQLFAHLVGLCVFPFIARPLLFRAFGLTDNEFAAFLEARKEEVVALMLGGLRPSE